MAGQAQDPLRRRDVPGHDRGSDDARLAGPAHVRDGPNGRVGRRALVLRASHPPSLISQPPRAGCAVRPKADDCSFVCCVLLFGLMYSAVLS